ncbi:hypothetical protein S83_036112, partial [Arachis hypogaea]
KIEGGVLSFNVNFARVRAYLLKILGKEIRFCAKVTSIKLEELKKFDSESALLHESKKSKSIHLPPLSNASEPDSRKRRAIGYNKLRTILLEKE